MGKESALGEVRGFEAAGRRGGRRGLRKAGEGWERLREAVMGEGGGGRREGRRWGSGGLGKARGEEGCREKREGMGQRRQVEVSWRGGVEAVAGGGGAVLGETVGSSGQNKKKDKLAENKIFDSLIT